MKSKVFLVKISTPETIASRVAKVRQLLEASRVLDVVLPQERAALKLHFGEAGNTGFVSPSFVRVIVEALIKRGAQPFLCDTNTLYRGRRTNSVDHLALAYEHGFTVENVKADVHIPDDSRAENIVEVAGAGRYIKTAKIARVFSDAAAIVGIAHFKGHIMTGFGGSLKNIGMGCATREGKLAQHSDLAPFVIEKKCTGCKACVMVCPANALAIKGAKAVLESSRCIGCSSCIAACKFNAMELNWEAGGNLIQEKMIDYAAAVLKPKQGVCVFLNFCLKITQECDCLAQDDPRIVEDIGVLASLDPVAIDQASFDLVCRAAGKDIFKELHPRRDGSKQLASAVELGLGSRDYELITVG